MSTQSPIPNPTVPTPSDSDLRDALLAVKFSPPRVRPGTVARRSLVDRLVAGAAYPLVVVSAPVGFGKATLLADWATNDPRRFVWVSLDQTDDDAATMLTSIARAIARVLPIDPRLFPELASPGVSALGRLVPRIVGALRSFDAPAVLVLRDLHVIHDQAARDALDLLVDHLPPNVQIAVTSRQSVWLADPRRRGEGHLLEVGADDLAFDVKESAQLMAAVGVVVGPEELTELVDSTGGWAAGLYLSALALRSGRLDRARTTEASTHPFISEYIRSEVLSQISPPTLGFLRRTAILDVMSGELCDAVLETTGSAGILDEIARTNLFVQPIDDRHQWFRCHSLFRATLLDDLVHHDADLLPSLHLRAAEWWSAT